VQRAENDRRGIIPQTSRVRIGEGHPTIRHPQNTLPDDLGLPEINDATKENLKARYEGYNPAELHREITRLQKKLLKMVISNAPHNSPFESVS
jgi:hypothetical protein